MRRRTRHLIRAAAVAASALVAVGLAVGVAAPAHADVDDFEFDSMHVDYTLGRADDGTSTLAVTEVFVAVFPEIDQNRGMRRTIPDSYLDAPLHPQLVSITDENGDPRSAETDSEDGWFTMTSRAGDYVHGEQTYVFDYRLQNVTRHFADTEADEFYWNVNGTDAAQPYGVVSASVHLDDDLAAALTGKLACYRGGTGSTDGCEITAEPAPGGGTVISAEARDLGPHQTMTIAVGFMPGTFTAFDPAYLASPWGWAQAISAGGFLVAFVSSVIVARRRLRDAPGRPTIIAEYDPPAGMDALEAAILLHRNSKAVPAEVVEQAVVGSIRIIAGPPRRWGSPPLTAQLVDPSLADGDGLILLEGLFPDGRPGDEFAFSTVSTRFQSAASKVVSRAQKILRRRGLYRRVPGGTRVIPLLVTAITALPVVGFGVLALVDWVDPVVPILLMVAVFVAFVVLSIVTSKAPLSAEGAEVRDHLLGLREFIAWAEADRIRMLQSPAGAERMPVDVDDPRQMLHLYERLLPYAVVFGQEKQWAERLAVLYDDDALPYWYSGSAPFSAASFAAGISSLSASASSSSSSSSGGSSGGGSAGGGGGGGGAGGV